jgi:hypothetical protein
MSTEVNSVYLVHLVSLVDLVHLMSFAHPKTKQTSKLFC